MFVHLPEHGPGIVRTVPRTGRGPSFTMRREEPMKLKPEDLVVVSFETATANNALGALATTTCPIFPTPATQCFVCPAPSSPEDGCY